MSVDGSITSSSGQVLIFTVWDMEMCLWVTIFLSETKVDNVDLVASLSNTHQEVIWLDITMDKGLCMNVLNARDELIGQKQNGLEGEFSVAEVEEIF